MIPEESRAQWIRSFPAKWIHLHQNIKGVLRFNLTVIDSTVSIIGFFLMKK